MKYSITFIVKLVVGIAVVGIIVVAAQSTLDGGVSQLTGWLP